MFVVKGPSGIKACLAPKIKVFKWIENMVGKYRKTFKILKKITFLINFAQLRLIPASRAISLVPLPLGMWRPHSLQSGINCVRGPLWLWDHSPVQRKGKKIQYSNMTSIQAIFISVKSTKNLFISNFSKIIKIVWDFHWK